MSDDPQRQAPSNNFILAIVVATLALVMVAVIAVLLAGLFHDKVDNDKILAILGPAFMTIVGAFVGVLSSRVVQRGDEK